MICTACGKSGDIRSGIKNGKAYDNLCERCVGAFTKSAVYAHKFETDYQKKHFRKDVIQRFEGTEINPEFVRAYPEQAAAQWGDEILREY